MRVSAERTFGDQFCLQAFSEIFNVKILLLSTLNDGIHLISPTAVNVFVENNPCLIIGHYDENNGAQYVSLEHNAASIDAELLKVYSNTNGYSSVNVTPIDQNTEVSESAQTTSTSNLLSISNSSVAHIIVDNSNTSNTTDIAVVHVAVAH